MPDRANRPDRSAARAGWLDPLWQDASYACRSLWRSPRFTTSVVASLAVGMAVSIAAFAFLISLLLGPFPGVSEQQRLIRLTLTRSCGAPDCWRRMASMDDLEALREGLEGLRGLAGYTTGQVAAALPEAGSMRAVIASPDYFEVLGVRPAAGRLFGSSDAPRRESIGVIAHRIWVRDFGADPSAIGRWIRVGDELVQIAGVTPEFFVGVDLRPGRGDRGPDVWLPMWLADRVLPLAASADRGHGQERELSFVGRLRDDVAMSQVRVEANVLARRLAANRGQGAQATQAAVRRVWVSNPENWGLAVVVVLPVPLLVLVIACVNAANLMLARGSQRQREIAVRLAIGARRGRIIRQLLTESAVLALIATTLALPMAWAGLQFSGSPVAIPVQFDAIVLVLTILTATMTTMAFGLAPAVRVSAQRPSSTLGTAGNREDAVPGQSRARRMLVIAQVALSLGLLATGWQLVATVRSQAVSGGTPADRLLIARFNVRPIAAADSDAERFYSRLIAEAARLPGVEAAGLARHTSIWTFGQGTAAGSVAVWEGADAPPEGRVVIGGYAGGELFRAVGVRTLAGRGFSDADRQGRPLVAVVNQTFAQRMEGAGLGDVVRVAPRGHGFGASLDVRIVGIVEPTVEPRLTHGEPPAPKLYLPSPIEPEPALSLYLRSADRAAELAQPVRELASRINPAVLVLDVGSLDDINERSFGPQLWLARAAAFLGVVGLLLATAGLYGVSSYVVAMRSREIAIRMALGASPRAIVSMVLSQSMRVTMIGLAVGGGIAVAVSRIIQSEYHGIVGIDAGVFGAAAMLFLVVMLLANAVPAVRASHVDPVETLRDV